MVFTSVFISNLATQNSGLLTEAAQHKYHITYEIICKSAYLPNFCILFYGTSHLVFSLIRMYYEDTKKE